MSMSGYADFQTDPVVGALRVAKGTRRDAAPCAAMLASPPRAARGRDGERLFILLDLTGPATPHLYRELREVVAQEHWSTGGSVTAAMRRAAAAANRHLFQFNLSAAPSERCYGGFTCAVLHGEDIFILQAGPGRACVLRRNQFECFPRGGELPHLGMGLVADVRLYHTFAAVGDTLLLASSSLAQTAGEDGLARVLPRPNVDGVLAGLEQVGAGVDFTALVARLTLPSAAPQAAVAPQAVVTPQAGATPARETPWRSISARITEGLQRTQPVKPRPIEFPDLPPMSEPEPFVRPESAREREPGLGERVKDGAQVVGRTIVAAGAALVSGVKTLFRRVLPGAERRARPQMRPPRPVPKENRIVMMSIAIGVPILVAIVVALAWRTFGARAQIESLVAKAGQEKQQALATGVISETRKHWEKVLDYTGKSAVPSEDPRIAELRDEAQKALDKLDGVVHLTFVELGNFGVGQAPRQLVVHGQTIFILDPAEGWVTQIGFSLTEEGIIRGEEPFTFVNTGREVDGGVVGNLVDFVWVEPGGSRMAGGLVILEEGGGLVGYDPAWGGEGGEPHLTRSLLGTPKVSRAIDSFEGRLYILDPDENQIWRYDPQGDLYPDLPGHYFVVSPARSLADAVDIAIDANVYVLHADGAIDKYLSGEPQAFDTGGVPDGFKQPVALAVDQDGSSGRVYVADAGNKRVVVLEPDGAFCAQFRTEEAFAALEALAVDEAVGQFYVFSGGRLYVAPLPQLP
jgi:hypothetical protein